jgi:hypothetical protein
MLHCPQDDGIVERVNSPVRGAVEGKGEELENHHDAEEELRRLMQLYNGQRLYNRLAFLRLVDCDRGNPVVLHGARRP